MVQSNLVRSENLEIGIVEGTVEIGALLSSRSKVMETVPVTQDKPLSYNDNWERVKTRLRSELGEDVYSSWFKSMDCDSVQGKLVTLSVPTRFLKSWIQSHYIDKLAVLWKSELGNDIRLEINVRNGAPRVVSVKPALQNSAETTRPLTFAPLSEVAEQPAILIGSPILPNLTFDSFLMGRSNSLARAAAVQIGTARNIDKVSYNPLYLHSNVGLGKTHLMHAIANSANGLERKVLYLTAEKFMYSFVMALQNKTALAYKEALRGIDILLIDDLQFLQGKATQAEFSHTLNALIDAGKQVVVASDRAPADLEGFEDRVKSRLAGGLVAEIQLMDEAMRLEILKQKLANSQKTHPDFDISLPVLTFVAQNVTANGRDLEGAFNRLQAQVRLTNQTLNVESAERSIRDLIRYNEPKRVKIEDIQRIVAKHYNVSRADILSSRRTAGVVRPRQVAMYLSKTLTLRSLPEIGRRFGGRDHTTVLHAVRKIEDLSETDKVFGEELDAIRRLTNEG